MAVVVSATALPAGAAPAAEELKGSGSTLVAPLVAEWALAFQTLDRVKVTFTPTGSEAGIQAVSSRAVDFAASEAPMSPSQRAACHSCFQIPWSLTAIGSATTCAASAPSSASTATSWRRSTWVRSSGGTTRGSRG
jgi:phosphate transport system substrate-binding protein